MMRMSLIALLLFSVPALGQGPRLQPAGAVADANAARGDLLYAYDQSAWHVTDAMFANAPKSLQARIKGFVTVPAAGGYRTTFYGGAPGNYVRLFSAIWTGRAIKDPETFPEGNIPVSTDELRSIDALETVRKSDLPVNTCAKSINSIVLPPTKADEPVSVYLMTPIANDGRIPFGGHVRMDVKDGKIVAQRKFANTCIALDRPGRGGQKAVGAYLTHLLDPTPTEIHVFGQRYMGVPLVVSTARDRIYWLELKNGRTTIRRVADK